MTGPGALKPLAVAPLVAAPLVFSRRAVGKAAAGILAAGALARLGASPAAGGPPPAFPLDAAALAALGRWHGHFPGCRRWRLLMGGIEAEGIGPLAEQATAAFRAWEWFGREAVAAAVEFAVPVELLIATLATETVAGSAARSAAASARGSSGEWGAMQTLPATARMALGRRSMPASALLDPLTAIRAGAAYIAMQAGDTGFDPPLVAGAYNAGGVYPDRSGRNPWRLRCYPIGTGRHVSRFCANFGDAMVLVAGREAAWGRAPSFAEALRAGR